MVAAVVDFEPRLDNAVTASAPSTTAATKMATLGMAGFLAAAGAVAVGFGAGGGGGGTGLLMRVLQAE